MKKLYILFLVAISLNLNAQSITETKVTEDGILIPRLTTTDRMAVSHSGTTNGMLVFDQNESGFFYSDGSAWQTVGGGNTVWVDSTYYASYLGDFIEVRDTSEFNLFNESATLNSQFLTFGSTEDKDIMVYGADSLTAQSFSGYNVLLNSQRMLHFDGKSYGKVDRNGFETGLLDDGDGDVVSGSLKYTDNGGELLVSDAAGNNTVIISQDNGGFLQIKNATGDTLMTLSSNNINSGGVIKLFGTEAKIDLDGLELGYKQGGHTGIDGDIIPYNSSSFDIGNNIAGQNWDKMVANEFMVFSDARLKNNIQKVESGSLDKLMKLEPVKYNYKKIVDVTEKEHTGLLAQDVQKLFPGVVSTYDIDIDKDGNEIRTESEHLSMNYMELIPHLIKGMQEQQEQIDELKAELKNLKK